MITKIGISLVFVSLNVGLYFVFALRNRFKLRAIFKIAFLSIFILLSIAWGMSDNPDFGLIRISDFLLMNYALGYLGYRYLFVPYFKSRNMEFPNVIRQILIFFLIPFYTVGATTAQILLLFE
jgi:hypothetical protein